MGKKYFKDLTTFRTGGEIKEYKEVSTKEELVETINSAKNRNLHIFIIGEGSDLLVSDKEFDGLVIKFVGNKIEIKDEMIISEAGVIWDDLVKVSVENNLQGIECLSGIPGTVGAAPIQNIGAYGQEIKNVFVSLTAYNTESGKFIDFSADDCEFSYRQSIFKRRSYWQKYVITEVVLRLVKNGKPEIKYDSLKKYLEEKGSDSPSLQEVREAVLKIRSTKFENPKEVGNAGSFFMNPIIGRDLAKKIMEEYSDAPLYPLDDGDYKCSAGWLIEKAGWKGKRYKSAGVSKNHALILINPDGNAQAEDIVEMSREIIKDVDNKFGIKLEPEVQFINF